MGFIISINEAVLERYSPNETSNLCQEPYGIIDLWNVTSDFKSTAFIEVNKVFFKASNILVMPVPMTIKLPAKRYYFIKLNNIIEIFY